MRNLNWICISLFTVILGCSNNNIKFTESDFSLINADRVEYEMNLEAIFSNTKRTNLDDVLDGKDICLMQEKNIIIDSIDIALFKDFKVISLYKPDSLETFEQFKTDYLNDIRLYAFAKCKYKQKDIYFILQTSPQEFSTNLNYTLFMIFASNSNSYCIMVASCFNKLSETSYLTNTKFNNGSFQYRHFLTNKVILYSNYKISDDFTLGNYSGH